MLYLNGKHLDELGIDWHALAEVIGRASAAFGKQDFAQPIKPYLRFRDLTNRIIAMPAFVGEPFDTAGIKWIASFPKNIESGIKRAHSVTILNEATTGKPYATINSAVISGIRTAAVSGFVTKSVLDQREGDALEFGMTGFGPIGQLHLSMMIGLFGQRIKRLRIFDLRPIDPALFPADVPFEIEVVDSWQDAYRDTDVFTTCTVSKAAYVDIQPKAGALLNNCSLRDFKTSMQQYVTHMVVDDWDEVNREKTDIEMMHQENGLQREDTYQMNDLLDHEKLTNLKPDDVVMFNPMGLAIFDMAVAHHYVELARKRGVGVALED